MTRNNAEMIHRESLCSKSRFRLLQYFLMVSFLLCLLVLVGCNVGGTKYQETKAIVTHQGKQVEIIYEYSKHENNPPFPLENLLDSDDATKWSFYGETLYTKAAFPDCTGSIFFKFDHHVKLKSITIKQDKNSRRKLKNVSIVVYHKGELYTIATHGSWSKYNLENRDTQKLNISNNIYMPDLYIKSFLFISEGCYGDKKSGQVVINGIELEFTDEQLFAPSMKLEQIKSIINDETLVELSSDGFWKFKDNVKNKDALIDKINRNLIHYSLKGNGEAEKLFLTNLSEYKKIEGVYGRDSLGLTDWYKETKKILNKRQK